MIGDTAPHEESAGDATYRLLRSNILLGHHHPGAKLKLERLRVDYSTSVSTLREILSRLSSEKLVVAEGQRGFEVAPISEADLRQTADLRLLLENHALSQSFEHGDLEWEATVVAAHHKLAQLEERMRDPQAGAAATWKRYDWQFHQALISACGSRLLMQTHATVFDRYLRYQMIALGYRGDVAIAEHRGLLDAALARDADHAIGILRAHVEGGVEHALATGAISQGRLVLPDDPKNLGDY